MMAISKEHIARYASEHRDTHPELATYARLEWGGHTGWLRKSLQERDHLRTRISRLRASLRLARPPRSAPTASSPAVLLDRVRIHEGLEIVISVGLPDLAGAGLIEIVPRGEDSVQPDLTVLL